MFALCATPFAGLQAARETPDKFPDRAAKEKELQRLLKLQQLLQQTAQLEKLKELKRVRDELKARLLTPCGSTS